MFAGEVDDLPAGGGTVLLPLAGPDHHVRADLQPVGGEHRLHVLLVLADGGGEHARADVGHTGQLQQALEGAVLAVGAVQHGEDDVDLAQRLGHRARFAVDDLAAGGVDGQQHAALGRLGQLLDVGRTAFGDRHAFRFVGGEGPAAVPGDADRQDVVARPVDGREDGAGGDHGDPVFGTAPAEHDGHTRLAGRPLRALLRVLGEVLGAHIALRVPARGAARQRRRGRVARVADGIGAGCATGRPASLSVVRASRCATSVPSRRPPETCPRARWRRPSR
ncbi:hypothetical protein SGLAM104S_03750 [Streptomyces glaucescens]